ncbi:Bug family tripartite tricarboxylate transporter substrate binding protein [Halarchaeum acidiphilum]|uniref:Bug family tripartite tricarboxylate transporter substrate binding protein n=1 Tax=Halarchaeum acidiphilum TaxID=489138 RepID=UPI0009DC32A6
MAGFAGCSDGSGGGDSGSSSGDGSSESSNSGSSYPSGDLKYIVPFAEGGGTDTYARQVIPEMADDLGVNIAIENVPGAASLRGTGEMYHAEPNGQMFGGFNPPSTPISAMVNPPGFDLRDLVGVGTYARTPFVIVSNPKHEINGMNDLISRYQNGELSTFAGKERGGVDNVTALLLKNKSGYDLSWEKYVGYQGSGPAVQATISGEVPACISTDTAAEAAVSDGRVDAVTCLSSTGTNVFPDLQSTTDAGYPNIDFIGQLQRGMYLPPETPDNIVQSLTGALKTALQTDHVQQWSENTGNVIEYGKPSAAEKAVQRAFEEIPNNVDIEQVRKNA